MILRLSSIAEQARFKSDGLPKIKIVSISLKLCIFVLILVGFAARLIPFIDLNERLFWQYMTEDGYLLQTVARNIAIGLGMSTAEGTQHTNGVQPLVTFLYAALYFIAGGAKKEGIVLVSIFSIFVSAGAGYYAYKVAARVFTGIRHGHELAIVSAALWFAAPHTITLSMIGLETGIYFLAILFTFNYYLTAVSDSSPPFTLWQRLELGLLMGFTFLARNDAVFFIGGLLLAHLVVGDGKVGGGHRHRLMDCLIVGIVSLLVASPWLINNYELFGSIVPISGISESRDAHFGQNLSGIPAQLFTSAFIFAPIPSSIVRMPLIILMSTISVTLSLVGFWLFSAKFTLLSRRFFVGSLIFAAGISSYYGLFFGAAHFLGRYLYPLSPLLWIASTATTFFLVNLLFRTYEGVYRLAFSIVLILTLGAATFAYTDFARGYAKGTSQEHRQVVKWVQVNVPESQWVGAAQTGTLGFFHDRTINLDGKVNPFALRAILEHGDVLGYVRNSNINYIADWYGMADWVKIKSDPQFAKDFEVIVRDEQANLGVLRRIHPVEQ